MTSAAIVLPVPGCPVNIAFSPLPSDSFRSKRHAPYTIEECFAWLQIGGQLLELRRSATPGRSIGAWARCGAPASSTGAPGERATRLLHLLERRRRRRHRPPHEHLRHAPDVADRRHRQRMQRNQAMQLGVAELVVAHRPPRVATARRRRRVAARRFAAPPAPPATANATQCSPEANTTLPISRDAAQQRAVARRADRLLERAIDVAQVDGGLAQQPFAKQQEQGPLEVGRRVRAAARRRRPSRARPAVRRRARTKASAPE